jgi:hypothetical protein
MKCNLFSTLYIKKETLEDKERLDIELKKMEDRIWKKIQSLQREDIKNLPVTIRKWLP